MKSFPRLHSKGIRGAAERGKRELASPDTKVPAKTFPRLCSAGVKGAVALAKRQLGR